MFGKHFNTIFMFDTAYSAWLTDASTAGSDMAKALLLFQSLGCAANGQCGKPQQELVRLFAAEFDGDTR